jgi:hypothetical protein
MTNAYSRFLDPGLLVLSGLLLSSLVPGGPIETRDFSHITVPVLLGFNLFLTTLVLGSFLASVGLCFSSPWARTASFLAAASYVLVYAIDLAGWFPSSPTPMPPTLFAVETTGIIVALPVLSRLANARSPQSDFSSGNVVGARPRRLQIGPLRFSDCVRTAENQDDKGLLHQQRAGGLLTQLCVPQEYRWLRGTYLAAIVVARTSTGAN